MTNTANDFLLNTPQGNLLLNLAAGLTQALLTAGASRLQQVALGTEEERALKAALNQGMIALLAEVDDQLPPGDLHAEKVTLVHHIFSDFVAQPGVADNLLAMALAGTSPDLAHLATEFDALDFDRGTLPVGFDRCLTAYHGRLTDALIQDAARDGSPIFHQVSLGRTLTIQALLEGQQSSLAAVADQVRRLESVGGQTVYNVVIEQAIGPVSIGTGSKAVASDLPDDVRDLLNRILSLLGDRQTYESAIESDATIEARYRTQVIERYNRLGFAGLGVGDLRLSDVALDDVFVRLTLTVEKTVREPILPDEKEREERSRKPFRRREGKEDDRPKERIITVQEPISLGDALTHHALIVGEPGAGKSALLRWLAVTFATGSQRETARLGPQVDADRLPLLVELGRLPEVYLQANSRETPNWKVFLPKHLTKQHPFDDIPMTFLEQMLAAGRCLLLCDGLDEIADLAARRRIADSLADYARSSANRLVLSSRPAGVSGSEASLGPRFQRLTIQRFKPEDVRRFFGFLYAQYEELTPDEQAQEADALFRAVESAPKTLELATTPLLATLLLLLWNENGYLPERRVELYERCCQMLIESWEAQHDVAYTGVLAEIGWERHLRLLAPLAYAIHNTGQRTDAPASELIPVLSQAMQTEGLAAPASATLKAESFLRTLSLRSGLLQFLGADENSQGRYGFPHLTFQEYLTARYIAAQPDPDYIDLVMPHLHKAWWREVHLLVIGYLGSESEGAEKVSRLLYQILYCYRPSWQVLCSHRISLWRILPSRMNGQWQLRIAWVLAREFIFVSTGFFDCAPLGVNAELRDSLAQQAQSLLLQVVLDPGRSEAGDVTLLQAAAGSLVQLGQASAEVVAALVGALGDSEWQVRQAAAGSLVQLGQASAEVVAALVRALGDSERQVRQAAARSLGQLNQPTSEATSVLLRALNDCSSDVRKAAAYSLGQLDISSSDVFDGLNNLLNSSNLSEAVVAVESLNKLGQDSPKSLNVLLTALGDEDEWIQERAAIALGDLKYSLPEVIKALDDALDDINWVRFAALESLRKISSKTDHVLRRQLTAIHDGNWLVRVWAVQNLGRLGDSSPDVLQALTLALKDESAQVREEAAVSLGLLGDISYGVKKALIEAIESERGKGSKTILRSLWERDRHQLSLKFFEVLFPETRIHAVEASIWALGELGSNSPEIIERLINVLVNNDWQTQTRSIETITKIGRNSSSVVKVLTKALRNENVQARGGIAIILAQLEHIIPDVSQELISVAQTHNSPMQLTAANLLSKLAIKDETQLRRVLIALNRRLHDRNDDVRRASLTAIRRLLDGRQIPGYRWVPIRERQHRAQRRKRIDWAVLGLGLVVLALWIGGVGSGQLDSAAVWVWIAGGLAALTSLAASIDLLFTHLHRPPWDQ